MVQQVLNVFIVHSYIEVKLQLNEVFVVRIGAPSCYASAIELFIHSTNMSHSFWSGGNTRHKLMPS